MRHRFSRFYEPALPNPIDFCEEVSAEEGSRKIFCLDFCCNTKLLVFPFKTQPFSQDKKKSLTPACSIFSAPHTSKPPCDKKNPSLPSACLNINIPASSASF
ncbi:hypothetical protein CDAR_166641 [Caerostris darwini]|uniref:Uncharacterized protein n=1 Tax=Caerostris darwini TaxID=1538125 RepID=A0AAV4NEH9_9ARAC|nr:hypothetical protein CDAR_166641 [Caerostris darwini]